MENWDTGFAKIRKPSKPFPQKHKQQKNPKHPNQTQNSIKIQDCGSNPILDTYQQHSAV